MYIYSTIIQFCISDTTKRLQRYNFFFVSFNIYRKMRNFARKFTTKMNKTAQHMLLYSSIIIIGISLFLLAVVLALTVFVAIKKYEHYKHRRLSRKHRRRHVVKVKG